MKPVTALLLFAAALCGQNTKISSPVFTGSGLNDAQSAGTFAPLPTNAVYTAIITAAGTPDTFKWQKNGGTFTTGVSITGARQALADGVTIQFLATTGHTVGDQWVINVSGHGSLAGLNTISGGLGVKARTAEDKLREMPPSVLDFGGDPTGTADSTAAAQACVVYGYFVGRPCYFPAAITASGQATATYKIAGQIIFPTPATGDDRSMGIVGDMAYLPRIGSAAQAGYASQIRCTATYGTGDPATGCIQFTAGANVSPNLLFRGFSLIGPDSGSSITTTSNNGIMVSAGAAKLTIDNVAVMGFAGLGTAGIWAAGPEGGSMRAVQINQVDGCLHLSGAFNTNTLTQVDCGQAQHDGIYIEGSQSINFVGGSCQASQRTCIHLRGALGVHFDGMHVEAVNLSGAAPGSAASTLWCQTGSLQASCSAVASGLAGATSVSLSGLGTGTIPAGAWFVEQTGRAYEIPGSTAIVAHAATVTINRPLDVAIPASTTIVPLIQNGEAAIVEEAGYTSTGCDSHGRHCGMAPPYININNSFRNTTMNVLYGVGGLTEFANPPAGDAVQYANVRTKVDLCAGSPNFFPLVNDANSFDTDMGYCGNGLANADLNFATNGNQVHDFSVQRSPQTAAEFGGIISHAINVGNNNVFQAISPDGLAQLTCNLFWGNEPGTHNQYICQATDDGGATAFYAYYADLAAKCIGLLTTCSSTYEATIGTGSSANALNVQCNAGTCIAANGHAVVDSGGHIVTAAIVLAGGTLTCTGAQNINSVTLSSSGALTATCH